MTTEPRPAPTRSPVGPASGTVGILLRAGSVAIAVVLVLAAVGLLVDGSPAALGALVGGLLVVLVFGTGALALDLMARRSGVEALLTAMVTYLGQVIVLVGALVVLSRSGVVGVELSRGWLAAGVVTVAVAWSIGQVVAHRRARIPLYHLGGQGG